MEFTYLSDRSACWEWSEGPGVGVTWPVRGLKSSCCEVTGTPVCCGSTGDREEGSRLGDQCVSVGYGLGGGRAREAVRKPGRPPNF